MGVARVTAMSMPLGHHRLQEFERQIAGRYLERILGLVKDEPLKQVRTAFAEAGLDYDRSTGACGAEEAAVEMRLDGEFKVAQSIGSRCKGTMSLESLLIRGD